VGGGRAVAGQSFDPVDDAAGPGERLRRRDLARLPGNPGEGVEEVHAMLDPDPAALLRRPEPVIVRQFQPGGVVGQIHVAQRAQHTGLAQRRRCGPEGVVAHHVVDREPDAVLIGGPDQRGAFGLGERQGLLAEEVFAGLQHGQALSMVQVWRCVEGHDRHPVIGQQIGQAGAGPRAVLRGLLPRPPGVDVGHGDDARFRHGGESLQAELPESPRADQPDSDWGVHG